MPQEILPGAKQGRRGGRGVKQRRHRKKGDETRFCQTARLSLLAGL